LIWFEPRSAWHFDAFDSAQVTHKPSVFAAQNQNWERSDQPKNQLDLCGVVVQVHNEILSLLECLAGRYAPSSDFVCPTLELLLVNIALGESTI